MAINIVSGNLEYDLAVAIERYENESPIAAELIKMINQKPSQIDLINIYVGTIDALFQTIKALERKNKELTDALTHPIVLRAIKKDADRIKSIKEKAEKAVSKNAFFKEELDK